MARARKLFPIYGSSLANNMVAAIERGRVVGNFVSGYIDEYDRRGILGGPARDRELAETIGREVVFAMIVEVRHVLPRFFGKTQFSKLKEDEKKTVELFFREWTEAIGRAWNWKSEDRRQFARDLTLYLDFGSRDAVPAIPARAARERKFSRKYGSRATAPASQNNKTSRLSWDVSPC